MVRSTAAVVAAAGLSLTALVGAYGARSAAEPQIQSPSQTATLSVAGAPAQTVTTTSAKSTTARPAGVDGATRKAITAAVHRSPLLGHVPASQAAVSAVKLTQDRRWASALVTPRNGQTDPAQVLLQHDAQGRWHVRDLGTMSVGCEIAPNAVRVKLGLNGGC